MNDTAQEVNVGVHRYFLEEVACYPLDAVMRYTGLYHFGLVEQYAPAVRLRVENVHQLRSDAAADIGNDVKLAPVISGRHRGCHRSGLGALPLVDDLGHAGVGV